MTWTCSVCGSDGSGVARRCKSCNSIACSGCLRGEACTNCLIEDGDRWFAPAAEEPVGKLPRRLPLVLITLVIFGPILIAIVAEMMGRIQSPAQQVQPNPVHFQSRPEPAGPSK